MRLHSLLSRLIVAAGFVAVIAAPVRAQHVAAPPCEESGAPLHAAVAAPNSTADAHHSIELHSDGAHAPLGTPERHSEKRDTHRATPNPIVKAQRPTHQRSKNANRNAPATPGVGQLLRMSSGTKSELTMLEGRAITHHLENTLDRGPPADAEPLLLSPAALPRVHHFQAPAPASEPFPPRSEPSCTSSPGSHSSSAAIAARTEVLSSALPEAPHRGGSGDDRAEGAASQAPHPSGGSHR